MKKLTFFLFIAFMFFMFSCSSADDKNFNEMTYTNDIDQMIGWVYNPTIVRGDAHSGNYMCKVDTSLIYSYGFSMPVGDFPTKTATSISVSVWGKWISGDVILVATIDCDGKSLAWNGIKFSQIIPNPNEWGKVSVPVNVPKDLPANAVFNAYMWSKNKGIGYCDDYEISFQ